MRCNYPWSAITRISVFRLCPAAFACFFATPDAITISPRKPRVPALSGVEGSAGNDKTSVTSSLPRNWRLSARMRASDTSATQTSPRADAGARFASQGPRPRGVSSPSGHATLTRRRAAAIDVVSLHDRLHELVTHDVALVEVDERDAVDLADHFHRLHQP